jgi:hypothetical protein
MCGYFRAQLKNLALTVIRCDPRGFEAIVAYLFAMRQAIGGQPVWSQP